MIVRYDRPVSRSAFLARRLGLFALGMLVLVLLAHRFGPLKTPDFIALVLIAAIPAMLAVPLALLGLVRLWHIGALGGVAATWALIYAALPLALPGYGVYRYMTRPVLYDVSSDLTERPEWLSPPDAPQHFLPRPPLPSDAMTAQSLAYPGLTGRRYEGALDRVYEAVRKVAEANRLVVTASRGQEYAMPDFALRPTTEEIVTPNQQLQSGLPPADEALPETGPLPASRPSDVVASMPPEPSEPPGTVRLQLTTRTLILGLPFDAVIRLREEAEMTLVDMRVASRFGPHDLGIGDEIAETFLHALDAELLGIAGN